MQDSPSGEIDGKVVLVLLSRLEQLVLDKLYAGPASGWEAALARVVVAWAALALQHLVDIHDLGDDRTIHTRLDRVFAFASSEGVGALRTAPIPTIKPDGDMGAFRSERRIETQVRMYLRRKTLLRHVSAIQDDIATAVYDRPASGDKTRLAERIASSSSVARKRTARRGPCVAPIDPKHRGPSGSPVIVIGYGRTSQHGSVGPNDRAHGASA